MKRPRLRTRIAPQRRALAMDARTRAAWRPLTLCWSRPAVPATAPLLPRTVSHLHSHWHTQSRVDLAWTIQHHAPPARLIERLVTRPPRDTRTTTSSRFEFHRVTRTESQVTRAQLHSRYINRREIVHLAQLIRPPQDTRPPPACLLAAPPPFARVRAADVPPALRVAPAIRVPATTGWAALRAASPAPAARAAELVHARQFVPPPALVWPKAAPVVAPTSAAMADTDTRAPLAATPTAVARDDREPPGVPLARQVQAAVRANVMDAAVIDRLTDDVMKRVEKKLRIERERRGL